MEYMLLRNFDYVGLLCLIGVTGKTNPCVRYSKEYQNGKTFKSDVELVTFAARYGIEDYIIATTDNVADHFDLEGIGEEEEMYKVWFFENHDVEFYDEFEEAIQVATVSASRLADMEASSAYEIVRSERKVS